MLMTMKIEDCTKVELLVPTFGFVPVLPKWIKIDEKALSRNKKINDKNKKKKKKIQEINIGCTTRIKNAGGRQKAKKRERVREKNIEDGRKTLWKETLASFHHSLRPLRLLPHFFFSLNLIATRKQMENFNFDSTFFSLFYK